MALDPTALAILGGAIGLAGGMAGSAIGVGMAASAGAGTLAEEPGQFRNVILLSSLPMTQTFYGLIILILIISTVLDKVTTMGNGLAVLGCGIFVAAAEGFSAAYQGVICASGISLLPKTKGKLLTTTMILAVLVELWGILGIVFTVLVLSLLGLF
jgi:V/A-type H+-transporting ATPase subunit K